MTPAEIALTLENDSDAGAGVRSGKESAPPSAVGPLPASRSKPDVMEGIYAEYLLQQEKAEPLDLEALCARFPGCRSAVLRVVQLHQFITANPKYAGQTWPQVGDQYGDLTLLRELGRGSFSRVYLANEASTGDRLVVVKFSRRDGDEARTQGPLSHPHIVPILSASRDDAGLAVVRMPYLGSATLEDVLDRAWPTSPSASAEQTKAERSRQAEIIPNVLRDCAQPEDPPVGLVAPRLRTGNYADGVIHLAGQLADALAFLHEQGVCHCDLKPSNVLLDPSGKPLLLDFNLSTSARDTTPPSGGTLRYMAPEMLHAYLTENWEGVDERAELYALAVMIYELLAGDHPHGPIPAELKDQSFAQFLLGRMNDCFRPLREVCPDVERPVARVLERCLALDPADRPRSAAELAVELKRQFSPARRTRRWLVGHPRAVLCALCVFLFGSMAAGLAWSVTPPYSERQYQRGVTAYRAGDYDEAEKCFDRAFQADAKNPRYRFARGVARVKQSKYLPDGSEKLDQAWNDIRVIADGEMDDRKLALKAYILNREQKAEDAIGMYTKLLQGTYRRAMALNNRAYSYLLRNNQAGFDLAMHDLDEAVQLDPDRQAIRYNRAKVVLFRQLTKRELLIPQSALDDIDGAIQLGPTTSDLYSHAAQLYAFAVPEDLRRCPVAQTVPPSFLSPSLMIALNLRGQQRIERCLSYLRQALASGASPELPNHPVFNLLRFHSAFPIAPPVQTRLTTSAVNLGLIEPVELPD